MDETAQSPLGGSDDTLRPLLATTTDMIFWWGNKTGVAQPAEAVQQFLKQENIFRHQNGGIFPAGRGQLYEQFPSQEPNWEPGERSALVEPGL
ncbi:hypothetical protein [Ralstonia pseudosolanacearum]|uniref:hypothetical protein n=2 Tax=Ralstonia pseudosolanacearum TaxID=1310165 RepID=UPI001FF75512|nr:hypothetical protein [Ralstonia pseudosolanacearum]